ncbi:hypothetical protein [Streptomyces sp. NPDC001652]|uniref:hypothetical protein n=1 Tax=Streptomyces sp. NPDC001652 TaxID=3154393 RepID=UPI0033224000
MPTPNSVDDIRRLLYPYLKAILIIVVSMLTGVIAGLVAKAFAKPWWDCLGVVLTVTAGTAALLFTASIYVTTVQANHKL